jgi:hypothetical protein
MSRSALTLTLTIALALVTTSVWGQGGPPLETDDPGTPGSGNWELNVAVTLERTAAGTLYEAPVADVNYGVGDRIQLNLEVPLQFESASASRTGFGDPGIAVKWRFVDDSSTHLALSTYPRLEFRSPILPLGEAAEDGSALLLPLELVVGWAKVGINAETGYRLIDKGPDEMVYRLALGLQETRTLQLLSECSGVSDASLRSTELICQLGARKDVAEQFTLLGAVGTAVAGNVPERTQLRMYLGLQSRW